jgi:hypothetical protein
VAGPGGTVGDSPLGLEQARSALGPEQVRHFFFSFSADEDQLAWPALYTVLEMSSWNQGSELSSATMIPQWVW